MTPYAPRMTTRDFTQREQRADWLRQRLHDLEMTQKELGKRIGITDARVSKWITHESRIPESWWLKIREEIGE